VLSFSTAFIPSLQVVGVISIFVLVEVDIIFSDIMQASENDSKTFHKLIRMQRSNSNINTDILILDGTKYTEDELMDGWKIIGPLHSNQLVKNF
jgi:hypothetical protein